LGGAEPLMSNTPKSTSEIKGTTKTMPLSLPTALKTLVFDLDGTLVDSSPGIATSLAMAFKAVGRVMPTTDFRRAIGPPLRGIARRVEPTITEAELDVIEPLYRSDYDSRGWRDTVIFDGVVQTLTELQAHSIRLFIVTNKPVLPTRQILEQFSLQRFFTEVLSRDSRSPAFSSKAEMLATLIKRHKLSPESTLMVGDTIEDLETAHANNVPFLYVTYGFGSVDSPHSIDRFPALGTLLKSRLT
jgi:phosphoglycolate phosphatase